MSIAEQVENLLSPIATSMGYELVDIKYQKEPSGWVLRILIDGPEGITMSDCEKFSQKAGGQLDSVDMLSRSYNLEVSSPGVYRTLKKEKDYIRFKGQRAVISLYNPIEGQRNFRGILLGIEEGGIVFQSEIGKIIKIPPSGIAKARLDPVLEI